MGWLSDSLPTQMHAHADPEVGRRQCALSSLVGSSPIGIPHTGRIQHNFRHLVTVDPPEEWK